MSTDIYVCVLLTIFQAIHLNTADSLNWVGVFVVFVWGFFVGFVVLIYNANILNFVCASKDLKSHTHL